MIPSRVVTRSVLVVAVAAAALGLSACAGYTAGHPHAHAMGQPGYGGGMQGGMHRGMGLQAVLLTASLGGAQEVPPNTRPGTGAAEVRFDRDTRVLTYKVTYSGLSGPVIGAHIHGPAAAGANAPVVVPFAPAADGSLSGTATLNPTQAGDLLAGLYYVNLHTAAHPAGEVRGQLRLAP